MMRIICILVLVFGQAGACLAQEPVKMHIDEVIDIALRNNLQLQLHQEDVTAANGAVAGQQGAFDPLVTATGFHETTNQTGLNTFAPEEEKVDYWAASMSKKLERGTEIDLTWENQRYTSDSMFTTIDPFYSSSISIGVTQPLLKGWNEGAQTADLRAAEKGVEAADSAVAAQAVELGAEVKKAYWQLLYARQENEVRKLSLELARRLLDDTTQKIDAGILAPVEIYQPESEVARREEALIAGEQAIADAEDILKLILNQPDWGVSIVPTDKPRIIREKVDFDAVLANAMEMRKDLQTAKLQVEAAELLVKKSSDGLKPSLDLDGRLGFSGTDTSYSGSSANIFGDTDLGWKVGLTFSMPLGNNSSKGADIAARAQLSKARTSVRIMEQQVTRSCREAVRNMTLSLKKIEASEKTSLAQQKRLEAEQNKFDAGLSIALDVLEAQEAFAQALAGQKRAMVAHALARAELARVQGVL